jgi:hypothetical protein
LLLQGVLIQSDAYMKDRSLPNGYFSNLLKKYHAGCPVRMNEKSPLDASPQQELKVRANNGLKHCYFASLSRCEWPYRVYSSGSFFSFGGKCRIL